MSSLTLSFVAEWSSAQFKYRTCELQCPHITLLDHHHSSASLLPYMHFIRFVFGLFIVISRQNRNNNCTICAKRGGQLENHIVVFMGRLKDSRTTKENPRLEMENCVNWKWIYINSMDENVFIKFKSWDESSSLILKAKVNISFRILIIINTYSKT